MSKIKTALEYLVGKMNANGDEFQSFLGLKGWQNIEADEAVFPVVFFDMPIKSRATVLAGGAFQREYILTALFLYKSELDSEEQLDDDYYAKAEAAEKNFILLLDSEKDVIKSYTLGDDFQIPHEFDAETSGIVLPFRVVLRDFDPVCLT